MSGTDTAARSAVLVSVLWVAIAAAAEPPASVVTDADIARARRSQPSITDRDIDLARRRHGPPDRSALERSERAVAPSSPRVDALPRPVSPPLDLGAIAQGFTEAGALKGIVSDSGPFLMVFVSLSMPEATLTRLVDQASRARAPQLLRGLSNSSLTQTVAQVQRLIGKRTVGVQIDPLAFDRYAIDAVPAFVLRTDNTKGTGCDAAACIKTDAYAKASGDVSLDHALRQLGRGSPAYDRAARTFLRRLER